MARNKSTFITEYIFGFFVYNHTFCLRTWNDPEIFHSYLSEKNISNLLITFMSTHEKNIINEIVFCEMLIDCVWDYEKVSNRNIISSNCFVSWDVHVYLILPLLRNIEYNAWDIRFNL